MVQQQRQIVTRVLPSRRINSCEVQGQVLTLSVSLLHAHKLNFTFLLCLGDTPKYKLDRNARPPKGQR